jgi:hypothetical protein
MDIEGAEYRNLLHTTDDDLARFRIIVIELHKLAVGFTRPRVFNRVIKPFLQKLDQQFICVHAHPNNVLGAYTPPTLNIAMPRILELTFPRKDRLNEAITSQGVSLPHLLDINNVPEKSPLHLSPAWLNSPRNFQSRALIVKDWLIYFQYHSKNKDFSNWSQLKPRKPSKTWFRFKLDIVHWDSPQPGLRRSASRMQPQATTTKHGMRSCPKF